MNAVGNTTAGAASGETTMCGAEGFTISGKRTEDGKPLLFLHYLRLGNPIFFLLHQLR